jgi:hypothetical protein
MLIRSIEVSFSSRKGTRSFSVWAIGEKRVFLGSILVDEVGDPREHEHKLLFLYKNGATLKDIKVVKRGNDFYCAKPQWYFPLFSVLIEEAKKRGVVFPPYIPSVSEKENWWDK